MYGYFEVEASSKELVDFDMLVRDLEKRAEQDRKHEAQARMDCSHAFTTKGSGVSKAGKEWMKETCLDSLCGAIRWGQPDGTWSPWSFPVR